MQRFNGIEIRFKLERNTKYPMKKFAQKHMAVALATYKQTKEQIIAKLKHQTWQKYKDSVLK